MIKPLCAYKNIQKSKCKKQYRYKTLFNAIHKLSNDVSLSLPTLPIGDLDILPIILLRVPLFRYSAVPNYFLISIVPILDISERLSEIKQEIFRF